MKWFAYDVVPVDSNWEYLKTVRETVREIAINDAEARVHGGDVPPPDMEEFIDAWESAKDAATAAGWVGEPGNEPLVFWLPVAGSFTFGFVIRQDNDDSSYVISPVELPHLGIAVEMLSEDDEESFDAP
ncbi:hypothetical protein [Hydrocarboniphaga sp.]|uniref:hypothetical protein n=1 Tax=Hydrocarboniphaga sp. TaxID=2033016 RepID=UPI003D0EA431